MHKAAYEFIREHKTDATISVIEIGSRNINGTVRDHFPNATWTGLDLYPGPCVDVVCDATQWTPKSQVDLVICCEVLEHTPQVAEICNQAYEWLRDGGRFIGTAAGIGRAVHSAIDGRKLLHPGEHYANISPRMLEPALARFSRAMIRVVGTDIQWCATK